MPCPLTHKAFVEELYNYKQGKGSVQFPHHKELPLLLIKDMILFHKKAIDTK